jgi:predicted ester cyclase
VYRHGRGQTLVGVTSCRKGFIVMAEDTAAPFRRFIQEVVNGGNVAAIDDLMPPDLIEHEPLPPGMPQNREGVKELFTTLHQAFPDLEAAVEDEVVQGDKVVFRMTWQGRQDGDFFGIPPTGKRVTYSVIDIVRVVGGKVVEHWGLTDQLGLMQQLGGIPQPGGPES